MLDHSSPIAEVKEELDARSRRVREIELRKVAGSEMLPCGFGIGFGAEDAAAVASVREEEALAEPKRAVDILASIVMSLVE